MHNIYQTNSKTIRKMLDVKYMNEKNITTQESMEIICRVDSRNKISKNYIKLLAGSRADISRTQKRWKDML